uniref:Reverse transcriptase zinc-binding domain-containing protein n=1 Tax=Quercus lobata TaxID=97700 RepID=A0A7N2LDT8_QUELO
MIGLRVTNRERPREKHMLKSKKSHARMDFDFGSFLETPIEGLEELASNFLLAVEEKIRQRAAGNALNKKTKGGGKGLRESRSLDRLSTFERLVKWGWQGNLLCGFCRNKCESRDHIFFVCSFSSRMWQQKMQSDGLMLFSYDPESQQVKNLEFCESTCCSYADNYVENLVLLDKPNDVVSKEESE